MKFYINMLFLVTLFYEVTATENFKLKTETIDKNTELISIKRDNTVIELGTREKIEGAFEFYGINPNTISLKTLKGTPDLLLIQWKDYAQGSGRYQHLSYKIFLKNDLSKKLLEEEVLIFGRAGWASIICQSLEINYKSNALAIILDREQQDYDHKKKPLFFQSKEEGHEDYFKCEKVTKLIRTFAIKNKSIKLQKTTLEYQKQNNEQLNEIIDGLELNKEWKSTVKNKSVIFSIPNQESIKRYPLIKTD